MAKPRRCPLVALGDDGLQGLAVKRRLLCLRRHDYVVVVLEALQDLNHLLGLLHQRVGLVRGCIGRGIISHLDIIAVVLVPFEVENLQCFRLCANSLCTLKCTLGDRLTLLQMHALWFDAAEPEHAKNRLKD